MNSGPDHALDAIRALVAEHDTVSAEMETAHSAHRDAVATLSSPGMSRKEYSRRCDEKDATAARIVRAMADLDTCVSKGALLDIVRHLLDVVGRQRAELKEHEWAGHNRDLGLVECCPRCGKQNPNDRGWLAPGHKPDCALDALLRETA